ncbi:MAG: DUF4429 domain-containing protein [Acidimicrobiia bacterium]|nr:DUF4429 domain-containing protein [Acidimicrobiia bacterium]
MDWTQAKYSQVQLTETDVHIRFVSKMAKLMYPDQSELTIAIASIKSLQWTDPKRWTKVGSLRFDVGQPSARGTFFEHNDPYEVEFDAGQLLAFEQMRDEVQTKMIALRSTETGESAPKGVAAEIRELASLRDDGLITDDEYEKQKMKLLDN